MSESRRVSGFERLRGPARERAVREVLARWQEANLSKAAFCRQEGIASITLSRWLAQFGPSSQTGSGGPRPRFVEALLTPTPLAESFEIVLGSGTRVSVPRGFDEGDLARLLGVLSSC